MTSSVLGDHVYPHRLQVIFGRTIPILNSSASEKADARHRDAGDNARRNKDVGDDVPHPFPKVILVSIDFRKPHCQSLLKNFERYPTIYGSAAKVTKKAERQTALSTLFI